MTYDELMLRLTDDDWSDSRPAHEALSWYGRMHAALCEAGRPDLAKRLGVRGPDWLYDANGERLCKLPGGACPKFNFMATEAEWHIIARAFVLTQQGRNQPGLVEIVDEDRFVELARNLGRIVS